MQRHWGQGAGWARLLQPLAAALLLAAVIAGAGAVLVFVANRAPASAPRAVAGLMDLRSWDFARAGPLSLDGGWGFRPRAFAAAGGGDRAAPLGLELKVPGDWRRTATGGVAMGSAYGYGSYSLSMLRASATELALMVPDEAISWRLFVDGVRLAENGSPAASAGESVVRRQAILVPLPPPQAGSGRTELAMDISNYSYDVGGLINPILIGPPRLLAARLEALSLLSGFFLGGLVVIALYHFFLFMLRIDDRASLYFSLLCILFTLRSLAIGHYPERLFPGQAVFDLSLRIEYLTFYLAIPVYLAFVRSLFPEEAPALAHKLSLGLGLAFCLVALATPPPLFMAWTTKTYQAVTIASCLYALAVFARAAARRRKGALYGLAAFAVLVLIIVNDILHADLVIRTAHLSPLGLMILMLANSYIVSSRIATTFAHERQLGRELSEEKLMLDARIAERTAELTASNQRLLDVDRAKSRFLATISHELRTPMTLIVSPLEQALRGRYGQALPVSGEIFARLLHSAYRMLNIVEDMFDIARLELGKLAPRMERVELGKSLAFYSTELESLAQKKGLTLGFEDRLAQGCAVDLDRRLFEIAFFNLVSNALKFTPGGGTVLIVAEGPDPGGRVAVEIRDTGIGIAPALLPGIFDKLDSRLDETERLYDGAGIGLSLTKRILALHGGEIRAKSSPGEGSTFTMLLPAARDGDGENRGTPPMAIGERGRAILGESLAEAPGRDHETQAGSATILLVEDNPELLGFMRERLEHDFTVHTAMDGEEALRALEAGFRPEIVVTDIMMPRLDGRSLFREARLLLGASRPPFIFLTARNAPEERLEALAEGAVDYLGKPFDLDELVRKIESLLALRRTARDDGRREVKEALARFLDEELAPGAEPPRGPAHREAEGRRAAMLGRLSGREAQMAEAAARGLPDKEIARELGLSARTVSNTLARVYRKLGVETRFELIRLLSGATPGAQF